MRVFVGIMISIMAAAIIVVGTIFGLRIYNTFEHGLEDQAAINHQRFSQYADAEGPFSVERISEERANGIHIIPDEPATGVDPVVMLSGSDGSLNFEFASELAENGIEVYSLFYFGDDNQPDTLEMVPIEFFADFLSVAELEDTELTVIGHEKGAELALILTNFHDNINELVLYDPLTHVFGGLSLSFESVSPWTYNDEMITYIDLRDSNLMSLGRALLYEGVLAPSNFRHVYESALENTENPERARIPTSNFTGRALIFAGGEDPNYPSDVFARELGLSLDSAEVHVMEEAGHAFFRTEHFNDIHVGGTEESNAQAKEQSFSILMEFLEED